jgi:hypothetical protein
VSDFFTYGAAALSDTTQSASGGVGHYLRQFGPLGAESAAIYRQRLKTNRGNAYVGPVSLFGETKALMTPSFDCDNTGEHPPTKDEPGCQVDHNVNFQGRLQGRFPHVEAESYTK